MFEIGDKVMQMSELKHDSHSDFVPAYGTIGTVEDLIKTCDGITDVRVRWPRGSTVGNDCWWIEAVCVKKIEDCGIKICKCEYKDEKILTYKKYGNELIEIDGVYCPKCGGVRYDRI